MEMNYKSLFNLCFEHAGNLLIILTDTLVIIDINAKSEKILGWSKKDVCNQYIGDIFKKYAMKPFLKNNRLNKTTITTTDVKKGNHLLTIDWVIIPMNATDQENIIFVSGKVSQYPENHKLEDSQLNNIVKYAPGLVYWKDKNSVYQGCNDEFARLAGLETSEQVKGKTDFDLIWKEGAASYIAGDQKVFKTGKPNLNIEEVVTTSDNRKITVISNKVPLLNNKKQVIGIMGITTDITRQKEIEHDLKKSKEAAEAANLAKTAFIANISHDIRTPLSGVIGLSELLENALEDPTQKEEAHLLHDSGEELLGMLNDILDDVQAGHLGEDDIQNESFDLYQCIEDLVKLERPTTTLKHLNLNVVIDPLVPQFIISDRKKIHRTLLNLLGNAIKFTKVGQITIEIQCLEHHAEDVCLQFSVEDTGIGIPKDMQDKVFDRFFRATPSYKGIYSGHGLGLHIAQSYVNLLGGHITLTSEEGFGSKLCFDLRCKKGVETTAKKTLLSNEAPLKRQTTASVAATKITAHAPLLLLVEDNSIALKILESMVSKAGYRSKSVMNGGDALSLATSTSFDLMITDVGLPDISGTELTRRIREWEKEHSKSPLPIIGLTGHAREIAREECLASGMNDVFTKPADLSLIENLVRQFVLNRSSRGTNETAAVFLNTSELGLDLPSTEEDLFKLEQFPLFDPQRALQQLHDLSLLYQLLKSSISAESQDDIRQMQAAHARCDWEKIEKLAHKLKGGAVYIGTCRMQYACQYLERYYKAGYRALLDRLYHQLLEVNRDTYETLKSWLVSYHP